MDDCLISVIVPVYNESKEALERTFASLKQQAFFNFEIIIVDDGSKKETSDFCDSFFQNKQINVTVIHKINEGVSVARNRGILAAKGKYIMFLDAGDWIENKCLKFAYEKIKEYSADMLSWNHYYDNRKKQRERKNISPSPVIFTKENIVNLKLDMVSPYYDERYHNISLGAARGVWGKLYSSKIIQDNHIRFSANLVIGEDACFNLKYLNFVNKAVFVNEYLNHYFLDINSANRKFREDIIQIRCDLISEYCNFFYNKDIKFQTVLSREILSAVVASLKKYICNKKSKLLMIEKKTAILNMLNRDEINQIVNLKYDKRFFNIYEKLLISLIKHKNINCLLFIGELL